MEGEKSKEMDRWFRARIRPITPSEEEERNLRLELVESYRQSLKKSVLRALSALESLYTLNHIDMKEYLELKESLDKVYQAYETHK